MAIIGVLVRDCNIDEGGEAEERDAFAWTLLLCPANSSLQAAPAIYTKIDQKLHAVQDLKWTAILREFCGMACENDASHALA